MDPRYIDCACRHSLADHSRRRGCRELDSYGCPCQCPSFVISQETYEGELNTRDGDLPGVFRAILAAGFDPKARQ